MLINKKTNRINKPVFRAVKRIGDMTNFSFNWKAEIDTSDSEVWRMSTASNHHTIAYMSLTYDIDFVKINLIERERYHQQSTFLNIGITLISFACLKSQQAGFGGIVVFEAKNRLIPWYQHVAKAQRIGISNRMVILEIDAQNLVNQHLP